MKKLIPIVTLFVCLSSFAQRSEKMKERIKTQKIAFITDKLDLSSEEAQVFWPIYNAYENTTEQIKSVDLREIKQKMHQNPNLSDKEASQLLDQLISAENKMHNAKLKLVTDLKKVIPPLKIIKLKGAEEAFNKKLLERLRDFREKRKKRN